MWRAARKINTLHTNYRSRTNSNSGPSLYPRLVQQIYNELESSVSTSLKTAGQFPAIRYALPQPEFNAEQTMTKCSQQLLIYHPPTNYILNFATKILADRLTWNVEMLMALAFLVVQLVSAGFEILNFGASGQIETLFEYFKQE
ncbi:hypothetical protein T07_10638 [Trichinella nelsoni]|uniref:Uncharacterized protein n=1 Tax=Trichinella nelsoni TaxID=6336 RepID=A0A0V0RHU2_9BILA|nr:hypothetical protein T07_10638 [Trichinella nelsoni]